MAASVGLALPVMVGFTWWMRSMMPAGAPPAGMMAVSLGAAMVVATVAVVVLMLAAIAVWAPVAHWLLKRTGPVEGPLGRTCQAICYSSGAFVTTATPCLGQYVGIVWWIVSAVLAVQQAHRTSGVRATFAVITPPATVFLLVVGAYAGLIALAIASSPGNISVQQATMSPTRTVLSAVLASGRANNGVGPAHALELVGIGRPLVVADLVDHSTLTGTARVPAGDGTLDDFMKLSADDQAAVAEEAGLALPGDVIAHRLGDFVFTYHGIDLSKRNMGLWVVIMSPDPDANPGPAQSIVVGMGDGSVLQVSDDSLQMMLEWQNSLRGNAGLPPLPDPATVTHDKPAVASP